MTELFLSVLNMSISAGWLVIAVLLVRIVLKRGPKWIHVLLWGLVALRLMCPVMPQSSISLIPNPQTISPQIMMDPTPEVSTGIEALNSVINPAISQSFTPSPGASANPLQIWIPVLSQVWMLGIVALMVYTSVSYLILRRKVSTAVRLRDRIYQCEGVASPFVLGLIRPKIYLPYTLSEEERCHVIAHEEAHVRRRDHWWKPLGFGLLAVHWFNPLVWLAYCLLCRDIELACDEKVIRSLDMDARAAYSQALLSCTISRRSIAACPLAFGEVGVKTRIRSILHYKKPAFWVLIAALVVVTVVALCFLTNPADFIRNPAVQEYDPDGEGMIGKVDTTYFTDVSSDFAIGADQYGRAVFKDPEKALDAMKMLYVEELALMETRFDLKPLAWNTVKQYKKCGWESLFNEPEWDRVLFIQRFLDIYENSFTDEPPPPQQIPASTAGQSSAVKWFTRDDSLPGGEFYEIQVETFPGVTFLGDSVSVSAVKDGKETLLYTGMPIWDVYFTDLNGDGFPELCSTTSYGSGMIDNRVLIYDYANHIRYTLVDRGTYDYTLEWKDHTLRVVKWNYNSTQIVTKGVLVFSGDRLQLHCQNGTVEDIHASSDQMYVLIGFDEKIILDSTQQEKLIELLDNWNYSENCSEKDPCYGGQMFRVVIADSDSETIWSFGENGIAVNSVNQDGVFESVVKYDFDETLINKVKYIIFGENTQ